MQRLGQLQKLSHQVKPEGERYKLYGITYMWSLKCDTNKLIYRNRLIDIENKLIVTSGERGREKDKSEEFRISRYKLNM